MASAGLDIRRPKSYGDDKPRLPIMYSINLSTSILVVHRLFADK